MPTHSRTFRIFVSSTFSDLSAERDALQRIVFPRLRALCERHGARFQAIDLRWGISQEASLDQRTVAICLEEIARCRQVTPRPNFVLLLGDRYGWEPLPEQVPAPELEAIRERIADPALRTLLDDWYRRDDNAVPPVYLLRPREGAYAEWQVYHAQVERPLREAMRQAASGLDLPAGALAKYGASATHQEILHGMLTGTEVAEQVSGYFRTISNLDELAAALPGPQARSLLDTRPDGRLDADAHQKVVRLKESLRARLGDRAFDYQERWTGQGLTTASLGTLPETQEACEALLQEGAVARTLCEAVWQRLGRTILAECARLEAQEPLDAEAEAHRAFGQARARTFVGRTQARQAISGYLAGPGRQPLAIWGAPGSGKSALLARAAEEAGREHPSAVVVARYAGATSDSADVRLLLAGLCRELGAAYGLGDARLPVDWKALATEFAGRLASATAERPLILFLDALDQLSEAHDARSLGWLPDELPPHVWLVVSTLPGPCLRALQVRLPDRSLVALEAMPVDEGEALLDLWLAEAGRALQAPQRAEVLDKFGQCGLPLYLRLAFEEARRWCSFDAPPPLSEGVDGLAGDLFRRLADEAHHGETLVSRSLGYLMAAREGLGEDEMLDLLSADAEVMADFRRRSPFSPAVDRLPVVVWSRLFLDLEPYLAQREAGGARLLGFFHRQIGEAAAERALAGEAGRLRHAGLAAYFGGQPLWPEAGAPNRRRVSEQPYQETRAGLWDAAAGTLTALPFVEAKCAAGMAHELLADYDALLEAWPGAAAGARPRSDLCAPYARDLAGWARGEIPSVRPPPLLTWTLQQVQAESARLAAGAEPLDRLRAFATFARSELHNLAEHGRLPGFCLQQACNSSRSGPVAAAGEALLAERPGAPVLLQEASRRPPFQPFPVQWMALEGHSRRVTGVGVSAEGTRAVSGSEDRTLRVWDLDSGKCLRTLQGHRDGVACLSVTPDGLRAASGSAPGRAREQAEEGNLRLWDLETGVCLAAISAGAQGISRVGLTADGARAVTLDRGGEIAVWDLAHGTRLRTLRLPWQAAGEAHLFAFSADGRRLLAAGEGGEAELWDLEGGERLAVLAAPRPEDKDAVGDPDVCLGLAMTPDGRRAVLALEDGALELWDLPVPGRPQPRRSARFATPAGVVAESMAVRVAVTAGGSCAVTTSENPALYLWDFAAGGCTRVLYGQAAQETDVAITADGALVVSCGGTTVRAWDVVRGAAPELLPDRHEASVVGIFRAAGARHALSYAARRPDDLRVWEVSPLRHAGVLESPGRPGSAAERRIAGEDPTGLRLPAANPAVTAAQALLIWQSRGLQEQELWAWDLATRKRVAHFAFPGDWIALLADGRTGISAAEAPRSVSPTGGAVAGLWELQKGRLLRSTVLAPGHADVWDVSPDGRRLLTGAHDNTVRVWDLETGACLSVVCLDFGLEARRDIAAGKRIAAMDGTIDRVGAVRFSPDLRLALTGAADHTVRLWNLESGRCVSLLGSHDHPVEHLEVAPDGRTAASIDSDRRLRLWDLRTGRCLAAPEERLFSDRRSVAFAAGGRAALWIGEDGSLRLWDLEVGREVSHFRPALSVTAMAPADADGRLLVGNVMGEVSAVACPALRGRAPVATAVRAWLVEEAGGKLFGPARTVSGRWDDELRARCPWCGGLSGVPGDAQRCLDRYHAGAGLDDPGASYLRLPEDAWRDPALAVPCAMCGRPFRLNPWLVDGRDRPAAWATTSGPAERAAHQRAARRLRAEAVRTDAGPVSQALLEAAAQVESGPAGGVELANQLYSLAREALALHDLRSARALIGECERLGHEAGLAMGAILLIKGQVLEAMGDWRQALQLHQEAERLALAQEDGGLRVWAVEGRGRCLELAGDLDGARSTFREMAQICQETGDRAGEIAARDHLHRLGQRRLQGLFEQMRLQNAPPAQEPPADPLAEHREAERRCRESGDQEGLQRALAWQATILHGRGEGEAALPLYREQEALCRELGNRADLQLCLRNQALLLEQRKEWDAALALLAEREALCRDLGDPEALRHCLDRRQLILEEKAVALHNGGDPQAALPLYREQEALCRELGNKQSLQVCLGNQALVLETVDPDAASALLRERVALCRELGNAEALQQSLQSLIKLVERKAVALHRAGDLEAAMPLHRELEALCREAGHGKSLRISLVGQALILVARREHAAALPLLRELEALCRELPDPDGLRSARQHLEKTLEGQAIALYTAGNLEASLPLLQEQEALLRALGDNARLRGCLRNLAVLWEARRAWDEALAALTECEALGREAGDEATRRHCLQRRAAILEQKAVALHNGGQPQAALPLYQEQEALCREVGDRKGLQGCLANQALVARAQHEHDHALSLLAESEALCRELGLTKELAACLEQRVGVLGQVQAGDAAAASALAELEALYRSSANVDGLARTMARQALALGRAGRRAEALARAAEARQMALAANLPDLAARIGQAVEQIGAGR